MTTAILARFARLRARARTGIVIEATAAVGLTLAAFALLSFVLDRTFRLETGYRAAFLAVLAVVVARVLQQRLFRPLRVDLTDDELALAVERHEPLREALISAVQFARAPAVRGESAEMRERVIRTVQERAAAIRYADALDRARTLRWAAALLLVGGAGIAWAALDPASLRLWFARSFLLSAEEWPRRTRLEFVDPVLRVPQGDDLTVRVAATGEIPDQVRLSWRFAGGERGSEPMTLTGDAEFRATLSALLEPVVLRAHGGDGITEELRVELVERPVIADVKVAVRPPAYVGGEFVEPAADADVRVLRGSTLRIEARSDKPVQEAFLLVGEAQRVALSIDPDRRRVSGELVPDETGAITIDVVDLDRLGARSPPRLFVRVDADQAPSIDVRQRGIGSMVTAIARIPVELIVRDDLGLTRVSALHRVSGRPAGEASESASAGADFGETEPETPPEFTPLAASGLEAFVPGERELRAEVVVDLRDLGSARPGQTFALRFDAADNFGPDAPHVTEGEPAVFRVVSPEELSADLQRRQLELRRQLEGLLNQQRAARAQLAETLGPSADDPRAQAARQKLLQLAKGEREFGARAAVIAQSYAQTLDEALNNRLVEASDLRPARERVVQPLLLLSTEDFPSAASATEAFANAGQEDLRQVALATYDAIADKIVRILGQMQQAEGLAAVIAGWREFLKLWDTHTDEVSKRRSEAGSDIFGTSRDDKDKSPSGQDGGRK